MTATSAQIRELLEVEARGLGFHAVGVTAVPLELRETYYREWIAKGRNGTMEWMERNSDRRLNPER